MDGTTLTLLLLASLSLLADILFTMLFLFLSELRKGPGELIFMQSQAQLLLDLHWVSISAIWPSKNHYQALCDFVAVFNNFGLALAPAYSAAICMAALSPQTPSFWRYHGIIIPLSLVISLVIYFTGGAGQSTFGTCSLAKDSWAE